MSTTISIVYKSVSVLAGAVEQSSPFKYNKKIVDYVE